MNKYSYVGKYSGGGSRNTFYKVKGKKCGFKGFPNKSLATFAHAVQSELSKENLTPKVFSPVCRIRIPEYFNRGGKIITQYILSDWGYLTEIAEYYTCDYDDCDGDCYTCPDCGNHEEIGRLLDDIEACGVNYTDAHAGNFGYVTRNKQKILVVIDLGRESIGDVSDYYPEVCWDGADGDYGDCDCTYCRKEYVNA
jgi:hypothetical protein